MSAKERATRLIHSLKATGDEEVIVEASHLIQVVGMKKADELCKNLTETRQLVQSNTSTTPRLVRKGHATVDRAACLAAVEQARDTLPEEVGTTFDNKDKKEVKALSNKQMDMFDTKEDK